jgi:hypothetical protein
MRRTADLSEVLPALTTGAGNWNVLLMNNANGSYEHIHSLTLSLKNRPAIRIKQRRSVREACGAGACCRRCGHEGVQTVTHTWRRKGRPRQGKQQARQLVIANRAIGGPSTASSFLQYWFSAEFKCSIVISGVTDMSGSVTVTLGLLTSSASTGTKVLMTHTCDLGALGAP